MGNSAHLRGIGEGSVVRFDFALPNNWKGPESQGLPVPSTLLHCSMLCSAMTTLITTPQWDVKEFLAVVILASQAILASIAAYAALRRTIGRKRPSSPRALSQGNPSTGSSSTKAPSRRRLGT